MLVFFDSSAFAKRYVQELGSDTVGEWCDRATEIGLAAMALPEIISAFCRLQREDKITAAQYQQLKGELFADIEDAAIADMSPAVIRQAVLSLEGSVLRAMDAIHIGCAVEMQADVFISADQRQCQAAKHAGLTVERV
ncbi:MAG: twitching motility protein PilT [Gallionellales bacterium RIFOXYB12_FULL_54_9]|nr:MAG: twitching motility protein PilT [Gallionellales bacterium RIFOXYB12_FULL_54_9]